MKPNILVICGPTASGKTALAAARIHPNDEKRTVRALEVWLSTGKTITQHNRESRQAPS